MSRREGKTKRVLNQSQHQRINFYCGLFAIFAKYDNAHANRFHCDKMGQNRNYFLTTLCCTQLHWPSKNVVCRYNFLVFFLVILSNEINGTQSKKCNYLMRFTLAASAATTIKFTERKKSIELYTTFSASRISAMMSFCCRYIWGTIVTSRRSYTDCFGVVNTCRRKAVKRRYTTPYNNSNGGGNSSSNSSSSTKWKKKHLSDSSNTHKHTSTPLDNTHTRASGDGSITISSPPPLT